MKIIALVKREFDLRCTTIIIFCVLVAFLAVMYTAIYPSLQRQATQLINSLGNVYKDVGVVGKVSFSTLQNYISLEMFAVTWPILVTVFTASLSVAALAGEIEKGTLGMLLALPMKRTSIYTIKYVTGLLSLALFVIATIIPILLIAKIGHMNFQSSHFVTTAWLCFLFGTAVYSLALFISSIVNEKSHLYGLIGGVIFVMYVINAVAGLKPALANLKYISFFHYFNASDALAANHIPSASYMVFITISLATTALGAFVLQHRDITI